MKLPLLETFCDGRILYMFLLIETSVFFARHSFPLRRFCLVATEHDSRGRGGTARGYSASPRTVVGTYSDAYSTLVNVPSTFFS